jgi:hypothetical protein
MARRIRLVLGGRMLLWPFLLATGNFVAILALCSSVIAAEGITWVTDLDDADHQAREQKKLLIVVDFAEDFTRVTGATRSQKAYASVALSENRCRQLLDVGFVLVSRNVGEATSFSATLPTKGDPKVPGTEHAITYFVTPDGRVLHFLSGFVSAETFFKEAKWTLACYADAQRFPDTEQPQAFRDSHLERIPSDNPLGQFSIHQAKPSEADVFRLLGAARKAREQALLARLGENFPGPEAAKLLTTMAAHGEVEADQAHVLLSEMPLIRLLDLERPAWTVLTGQRFRQATSRRDELCQWLKHAIAKDKPVLLVVDGVQPVPASSKPVLEKVPWPPKSSTVKSLLPKVEVSQLSQDELAALIYDAKLPNITYSVSKPPRFVVLYSGGMRQEVISEEEGYTRLGRVLANAVESARDEPGAELPKGTGK